MCACVFATSFFKSLSAYVLLYGVLYGFTVGICYLIPMLNCYAYLPNKKGTYCITLRTLFWYLYDGVWVGFPAVQLHPPQTDQPPQPITGPATFIPSRRGFECPRWIEVHQPHIFLYRHGWLLFNDPEMYIFVTI